MGLPSFLVNSNHEQARAGIQISGGLASQADLARRWGMSRQRVGILVRQPGFPQPAAAVNGQPVWLADEAAIWRQHRELIAAGAALNGLI